MTGNGRRHCLAAEFTGTFGLVFAGTGAIVIDDVTGGAVGHVGIGLTFGLITMAMIYAFGHVSGTHLNPAASPPASSTAPSSATWPTPAPRCRAGRRGSRSGWRSCSP